MKTLEARPVLVPLRAALAQVLPSLSASYLLLTSLRSVLTKSAEGHFPMGSQGPVHSSGRQLGTRPGQRGLGGVPKPGSRGEVSPLGSPRRGWTLLSVISSPARAGFRRHNENSRTAHGAAAGPQPRARQRQGQCGSSQQGCPLGPTALRNCPFFSTEDPPHPLPCPPFLLANARPTRGRHLRLPANV